MKITGYIKADTELEDCKIMRDIGKMASSENLRELAQFFLQAADEMDELGSDFDHVHLMDEWPNWKKGLPDIQILNEKYA